MNTLYLHVGPHKTGTTLIQKFLLDNQGWLFKSNLVYPKRYQKIFGHHEFRELIVNRQLSQEDRDFFNNEQHDFLLSSEDFISLNKDDFEYLKHNIESKKIVVIFGWRRASFKLYSIWQEVIKHGGTDTFFSYYHDHLARPGQSQMLSADLKLNMFSHVFGKENIRIIDYDASAKNNSLLRDFIKTLDNVEWQNDFVTAENNAEAVNRSMDITDIEIIRALNHQFKALYDIDGAWVRTQFAQQQEQLEEIGLGKLKSIISAYQQELTVGNYFIDIRCETIMADKFANNMINYEPNTVVKKIRLAKADWMFNPEGQKILNQITEHLKEAINT
ncbi:hypothetical protein [Neptunicella sp. SCSIO 80796]|uniref:hypothetical protein n=1 Tax=Neptunicella plasticusilytica TaxID=3117012 RepID=UPI003A4D9EC5